MSLQRPYEPTTMMPIKTVLAFFETFSVLSQLTQPFKSWGIKMGEGKGYRVLDRINTVKLIALSFTCHILA